MMIIISKVYIMKRKWFREGRKTHYGSILYVFLTVLEILKKKTCSIQIYA